MGQERIKEKMKISKQKLDKIIKEEVLKVLAETGETREQGIQRIHQEKLAEIEKYLNGLPDGGKEYRQLMEMGDEVEDYINERGYDTNDPFIAKYDELSKKTMPIQKEVAKITKKHQERMSTELPKGEKSYVQMQYDRDGVGVQTYDRYLGNLEEGFLDTLRYLLTGAEPSELELAQREIDKAMEMLKTPSLPAGMGKPRKPPVDASRDKQLKLKLAQLKKARGIQESQTDLMADVNPETLSHKDELGVADSASPRSAKERLLAMLIAAEDIERLRAQFADDEEMQKELDKIEANPFYNPQGAYRTPRTSMSENVDNQASQVVQAIMSDKAKVAALKAALNAGDFEKYQELISDYTVALDPSVDAEVDGVEDAIEAQLSEGLQHHIDTATPLTNNVYRVGSDEYFNVIREARVQYKKGNYKPLNEEEQEMLESELGEWADFEGEKVPLDFPMYEETLDEKRKRKKKKKKKDPPIGKPMKNTGGGKKYKVYVRSKSGRVKKISYGDSKGGLKGNWNSAEARSSFAKRHNCAEKKDRTKAGYWACRAHKDFGTNVPGRFW